MTFSKCLGKRGGFTLLELLVVIAIIGVLSSVVLASLNAARAKSRDARRMADVDQIIKALALYNFDNNNWVEDGSGCGWHGGGDGWFNVTDVDYPKSIAQCLVDGRYTSSEIIDPTGGRTSTPSARYTYMKYTNSEETCVFAKLEGTPQSSTATDGTSCSTCDSSYGMNYYVCIDK